MNRKNNPRSRFNRDLPSLIAFLILAALTLCVAIAAAIKSARLIGLSAIGTPMTFLSVCIIFAAVACGILIAARLKNMYLAALRYDNQNRAFRARQQAALRIDIPL